MGFGFAKNGEDAQKRYQEKTVKRQERIEKGKRVQSYSNKLNSKKSDHPMFKNVKYENIRDVRRERERKQLLLTVAFTIILVTATSFLVAEFGSSFLTFLMSPFQ